MKEDTGQILIVDKIVNNNIVIAKDFRGREVVAIGKGVGFRKRKNEAVHRSEIMKTYVLLDKVDSGVLISGKIDTEQEIQTMFASKKLEFEIMCAVPFFIILYMKLTFGEFLSVLYENAAGRCFMTICLIAYIAAYSFGRKIIHIEV